MRRRERGREMGEIGEVGGRGRERGEKERDRQADRQTHSLAYNVNNVMLLATVTLHTSQHCMNEL